MGLGVLRGRMKKLSEHELQKNIIELLQYHGWYCLRLNSGKIRTQSGGFMQLCPKGTPDLMAIKRKQPPLFIEVKLPKGIVSPEQAIMMTELRKYGADCLVVRSIDDLEGLTFIKNN